MSLIFVNLRPWNLTVGFRQGRIRIRGIPLWLLRRRAVARRWSLACVVTAWVHRYGRTLAELKRASSATLRLVVQLLQLLPPDAPPFVLVHVRIVVHRTYSSSATKWYCAPKLDLRDAILHRGTVASKASQSSDQSRKNGTFKISPAWQPDASTFRKQIALVFKK